MILSQLEILGSGRADKKKTHQAKTSSELQVLNKFNFHDDKTITRAICDNRNRFKKQLNYIISKPMYTNGHPHPTFIKKIETSSNIIIIGHTFLNKTITYEERRLPLYVTAVISPIRFNSL